MLTWRIEERRERGEADCKFTAGSDTRTDKLCERNKWPRINADELTIIQMS